MQFDLFGDLFSRRPVRQPTLRIGTAEVPLLFVRNASARRYVLRLNSEGAVRVTIPRRGSQKEALEVAHRHTSWIEKQLEQRKKLRAAGEWRHGTEIWFRGERIPLAVDPEKPVVRFSDQTVPFGADGLRSAVEWHLRRLAACELALRARQLAAEHNVAIQAVTVRNQRSRWGSCSARGTISLNWRLILMPDFVRDYIILHELMHTREMNHSKCFWREVKRVCPNYRVAELWLKRHQRELR